MSSSFTPEELEELEELQSISVNFDIGKIGLYVIKIEAMLDTLLYNQAKLIAKMENKSVDEVFNGMKDGEKQLTFQKFKDLSNEWK